MISVPNCKSMSDYMRIIRSIFVSTTNFQATINRSIVINSSIMEAFPFQILSILINNRASRLKKDRKVFCFILNTQ